MHGRLQLRTFSITLRGLGSLLTWVTAAHFKSTLPCPAARTRGGSLFTLNILPLRCSSSSLPKSTGPWPRRPLFDSSTLQQRVLLRGHILVTRPLPGCDTKLQ